MTYFSNHQLPGVKPGSTPARTGRFVFVLLLVLAACGDDPRGPTQPAKTEPSTAKDVDSPSATVLSAEVALAEEEPGDARVDDASPAPDDAGAREDESSDNGDHGDVTERNGVPLFRGEPSQYWLELLDDVELRTTAALALAQLEPEGSHVVDRLLGAVEGGTDYPFLEAVARALGARGAGVEQRLREEAVGPDVVRSECAVLAFRFLDHVGAESMTLLERIAERNRSRRVRTVARQVFGERYVAALGAGEELGGALSHQRAYVRNAVLTRIQAEQQETVYAQVLTERLKVEHDPMTRNVLEAVVKRSRPLPAEERAAAHEAQIATLSQATPVRYTRPDAVSVDPIQNPLTLVLEVTRPLEEDAKAGTTGTTTVRRRGVFRVAVRLSGAETRARQFSPLAVAAGETDTGIHVRMLRETDHGRGEPVEFTLAPSGTEWDYRAATRTAIFFASVPEDEAVVAERVDRMTAGWWDSAEGASDPAAEATRSAARETLIRYATENVPGRYRIECTYRSAGDDRWNGTLTAAEQSFEILDDASLWDE